MDQAVKYLNKMKDFGEVAERQHSTYGSDFVRRIIENGGEYLSPQTGIRYLIPTHFGFCYGVEKSIDMAFETCRRFPDRRIFLTHDIIHNPKVNRDLASLGVKTLARDADNTLTLEDLRPEDVVVISAFGTRFQDIEALKTKDCVIVDTTCGAIVLVWKRVEKYARSGFLTVIHGVWNHEETRATASQAVKFGGHFLVIRNGEDAQCIGDFLEQKLDAAGFMKRFSDRVSAGFDPGIHLKKIGMASQTTMLKNETLEIQEYLKVLYLKVFGENHFDEAFMIYDTICSATQERQDALKELLSHPLDRVLIIGGFNSSNTTHLSEIASLRFPTYHIRGPEDILSRDEIRHLDPVRLEEKLSRAWLGPRGSVKSIGMSTGASTPDSMIEKVILRVDELYGR